MQFFVCFVSVFVIRPEETKRLIKASDKLTHLSSTARSQMDKIIQSAAIKSDLAGHTAGGNGKIPAA